MTAFHVEVFNGYILVLCFIMEYLPLDSVHIKKKCLKAPVTRLPPDIR